MKEYLQIRYFFLLLLLAVSCKSQKKNDLPNKQITNQPELDVPLQPETKLDHDPYFTENEGVSTSYGPGSITRNIIQDKKGQLWFASWKGIIRYDGKSFTNFTNKEKLRRFRAFSLLEDKNGIIWFGTIGAGLYRYDPAIEQSGGQPFTNITTKDGLVSSDVYCFTEDKKGNLWIGTVGGVSCYDGKTFRNFTTADGLADNDVNAIVEDKNGKFWIAARGESCTYDGDTFTKITTATGKTLMNVRSIIEDSKGNIWLGGQDGLWSFNGIFYTNHTTDFIGHIFEDSKGNIWVSKSEPNNTYSMSLSRYDGPSNTNTTLIANPKGQVFGITEDTNGNIWFGHENGVCRYDGITFDYFKH